MAISEKKMQIVIDNYFKSECDVNTSIRQAFEKGFRIGVMKGQCFQENKGEWIPVSSGELPKIGQRVLATIETYNDGLKVVDTMYDKHGFMCGNALAWQPLPEPYKADMRGDT